MLLDIFRQNPWRIGVSYVLLVFEFFLFALMPYLLGKGIDGLLENRWHDFHVYLVAQFGALILGFARRRFDNRAFLRIWAKKAAHVLTDLIKRGVDPNKIISRTHMIREFAHFLEFTIPLAVSCAIDITISLVMLWLFVPGTCCWIVLLSLLAILSHYYFSVRIMYVEMTCQRQREETNAAIYAQDTDKIPSCYERQRGNYVRLADLEAFGWGSVDILGQVSLVIVVLALVNNGQSAGAIIANVTYLNKVFEKINFLAQFFKHVKQLRVYEHFLNEDL